MKKRYYAPAALMTLIASCGQAQGGCTPAPAPAPIEQAESSSSTDGQIIGTSAGGRDITVQRFGSGASTVVIVGQTHGNEEASLLVTEAAKAHAWSDTTVYVIDTLNPDGAAVHGRTNGAGVDLNRDGGGRTQPESQAIHAFTHQVNANLIVWVHSPSAYTGFYGGATARSVAQQAAQAMGLPFRGYIANHPFLWVDDGENVVVEVPASTDSDCAGCSDNRTQTNPTDVSNRAAALMDVLDGAA